MSIVINLTPEIEAKLREKAIQQGRDISLVAAELLTQVLEEELKDTEEAIQGIQKGLDDFQADQFRSFDEFAKEQYQKYNLFYS
ncbi:MAG: hypothetical protein SWJ54_04730 [Cyanobacteriota bacterium]|nr:hypothetical protein [Cyanobacteriota bacterium]